MEETFKEETSPGRWAAGGSNSPVPGVAPALGVTSCGHISLSPHPAWLQEQISREMLGHCCPLAPGDWPLCLPIYSCPLTAGRAAGAGLFGGLGGPGRLFQQPEINQTSKVLCWALGTLLWCSIAPALPRCPVREALPPQAVGSSRRTTGALPGPSSRLLAFILAVL